MQNILQAYSAFKAQWSSRLLKCFLFRLSERPNKAMRIFLGGDGH